MTSLKCSLCQELSQLISLSCEISDITILFYRRGKGGNNILSNSPGCQNLYLDLDSLASEPIIVIGVINCSPVIATIVEHLPLGHGKHLLNSFLHKRLGEENEACGFCNLSQIALIILPNFKPNSENLVSIPLRVVLISFWILFFVSFYDIAFSIHLDRHRTLCCRNNLFGIGTNHFPGFKIRY